MKTESIKFYFLKCCFFYLKVRYSIFFRKLLIDVCYQTKKSAPSRSQGCGDDRQGVRSREKQLHKPSDTCTSYHPEKPDVHLMKDLQDYWRGCLHNSFYHTSRCTIPIHYLSYHTSPIRWLDSYLPQQQKNNHHYNL